MLTAMKQLAARVRAFVSTRELDRDFKQELESHLTMMIDDNVRGGMSPEQARRAALIRVGNPASIAVQHREVRGLPVAETLVQDLRFAFRLMAKDRWVSAAAILALALGIGANTTGFTVVNAAFLRGLPFEDADRLYMLSWQLQSGRREEVSHTELEDWRGQSRRFAMLVGYVNATMNISDDRDVPQHARGTRITTNGFRALRQQPLLGRDFTDGDERPGAEPVVIIGHDMWANRYAADPHVLGTTLRINGRPATIVGVMPAGVKFPDNTDIWTPFVLTDAENARDARPLSVYGRLSDGATYREAQTELNGIAQQLRAAYPEITKDLVGIRVETFTDAFVGGVARPMFITVMGAVTFVLLIACANVANLLLSRSGSRAPEIAVRMAMGATRWRIVRQLLLESLVLGLAGGGIGLVLALGGVNVFNAAIQNVGLPYWIVFTVDYVVFAYVAAVCVMTAVLFGLAPALHVSKTRSNEVLKEGARGTVGSRRVRWLSSSLVVAELALTIVLLAGAGLMIRSFMTLYTVDFGIPSDRLLTMRVQLPEAKYKTPEARRAFFDRLEPRLAAIAGVEAVAVTNGVPPLDGGERVLEIDGRARTTAARPVQVGTVTISPRFFDVLNVPLTRGRAFTDTDGAPRAEAVIINERLAAQFFPSEDPLGQRLRFTTREPLPGAPVDVWRTIVGITPFDKHGSPEDRYENAVVYIPYRQETPHSASLLMRSALPPASVMGTMRREVQAIDPDQPVFSIQTLDELVANERWWYRTWGGMFGSLAIIAVLLSSMGLYAVMAYSVTQRTQEIGVRMAVGAQRQQVSWLILKRGLVQIAMGLTIGLAGGLALSQVLRRSLVAITPTDPVTFGAITLLLTLVSVAACLLPARRATRVDPVIALRAE